MGTPDKTPQKGGDGDRDLTEEEQSERSRREIAERDQFFGEEGEQDDKKGDKESNTEFSRRTKKMLTLLSNQMKGKKSINFSSIVRGKTRQTAAAVFYQLLVLKTRTYVDLQQKAPYEEIVITEDENFSKRSQ